MSNPNGDLSGNDSGTKEFIYKDKDEQSPRLKKASKDEQSIRIKKASTQIDLMDQKYAVEKNDNNANGGEWVDVAVHCYTQKQLMAWDNLELLKVQTKLL